MGVNALERVKGIEPSSGAWKASALPLSYTRPGSKKGIIPLRNFSLLREIHLKIFAGGGGWIRTIVGVSQQIYSLPPLATRAPLRSEWQIMRIGNHFVKFFRRIDAKFLSQRQRTIFPGAPVPFFRFSAAGLPAVVSEELAFYTKLRQFQAIPKNICKTTPTTNNPQPALPTVSSHG